MSPCPPPWVQVLNLEFPDIGGFGRPCPLPPPCILIITITITEQNRTEQNRTEQNNFSIEPVDNCVCTLSDSIHAGRQPTSQNVYSPSTASLSGSPTHQTNSLQLNTVYSKNLSSCPVVTGFGMKSRNVCQVCLCEVDQSWSDRLCKCSKISCWVKLKD